MPKNLNKYLNYIYIKPKKKKKFSKNILLCILILLLLLFNNLGLLTNVTQNKYLIFKIQKYYLLVIDNNYNYNINFEELGASKVKFNDSTILNIYKSEEICLRVKDNIKYNNIVFKNTTLTFNNIYTNKKINSNQLNLIKQSLNSYINCLNDLIIYCEQFDKNLIDLSLILKKISSYTELFNNFSSQLTKITNNNLFSKTTILLNNGLNILLNINNKNFNFTSHVLKNCTVNFAINFYNIMY